ncbi:MAG: hypothetical protein AAB621_03335 [Patescibacteria group bacterium]
MKKENFPDRSGNQNREIEQKIEKKRAEIVALAKELSESHEVFHFSGIDPKAYSDIKRDEEKFPGYTTPIDELVERFKNEGMKVVLGEHPESGNVFILPAQSNDIENDSIFPRQLQVTEMVDERLKKLVLLNRSK